MDLVIHMHETFVCVFLMPKSCLSSVCIVVFDIDGVVTKLSVVYTAEHCIIVP